MENNILPSMGIELVRKITEGRSCKALPTGYAEFCKFDKIFVANSLFPQNMGCQPTPIGQCASTHANRHATCHPICQFYTTDRN